MNYEILKFEEDDQLSRKDFVVNLMKVISNWNKLKNESDSLVVSIDSPWGSGKSYLLNMWKNWLISIDNADNYYAVAYYNAWTNDDNENAFIPLTYALQNMDVYKENVELAQNIKEKTKNFIKACTVAFIKDSIKKYVGENVSNIINSGIDNVANTKIETFFDEFNKYKKQKLIFKEALFDLIPRDGKLIVFIDELDRCRPTFAVETLEIIKHYFDIPNIVFIFAVDLEQLSHSVSTLYGEGMDSSGYLRRFFDFNIKIPKINIEQYVKILTKKFVSSKNINHGLFHTIANLYEKLNLSLRDMNKITDNFLVFCLFYDDCLSPYIRRDKEIINRLETYLYFIILKYKYPNIYNLIIYDNFIAFDNQPHHYEVLNIRFFVSDNIGNLLRDLQNGGAHLKNKQLISKYGYEGLYAINNSFAEHMEYTIEMFVSNEKNEDDNIT